MEININNLERDEVEKLVKEMTEGEKGKRMHKEGSYGMEEEGTRMHSPSWFSTPEFG